MTCVPTTAPPTSAASNAQTLPLLIGFFFAARVMTVLLAVRVLGLEPQAGAAIGLALNYTLLALVVANTLGSKRTGQVKFLKLPMHRWIVLFLTVSGVSLFWTQAASLPAAIAFWCAMVADLAMVVLLMRARNVTTTAHGIMKGFVLGACAVALIAWVMPAQSDLRLGDEDLLGPNQIGYVCAFAFFFTQYLARCGKKGWSAAAGLLAVTLLRSLSKTTILAFTVSQLFLLARDRSVSRRTKLLIVACCAVALTAFSGLLSNYFDVYTHAGNQSETLTGRVGIWAFILGEAVQQPWIGHGFHSVWKVIPPFGPDHFEARHAHNELLQQFYAYGLAGVILFGGVYATLYRAIRSLSQGTLKTFCSSVLLFVLVRGLADTEAFDLSLPLWAIAMIGALISFERTQVEYCDTRLPAATVPGLALS